MSDALTHGAVSAGAALPAIREISLDDLRESLSRGFDDFRASPTQLVFVCLLYPLIGVVAARAAQGELLPLLFPLLLGLSLMGPVLSVGMYEISRQREAGRPTSWLTALAVLRSPALGGILILGAILLITFGFWIYTARAIYAASMGGAVFDSPAAFLDAVLHTKAGHRLIVMGNMAGAGFGAVVLAVSVVSLPMLLDRACSPALAVQTSVRAVLRSPGVFAVWGLIVAGMLALGSLPVFVGLAVVMPILGHATWHLYRRTVL